MLAAVLPAALAAGPARTFEVNGVPLGGREADIKRAFPSAYCKPLEWTTPAADRRCDDGKASFAGVPARITFYLRGGEIRAFDLRFERRHLESVALHLKSRWGAPATEAVETVARRDGTDRRTFRARWEKDGESALLAAPLERNRASLEAARGDFFEEVYRVR